MGNAKDMAMITEEEEADTEATEEAATEEEEADTGTIEEVAIEITEEVVIGIIEVDTTEIIEGKVIIEEVEEIIETTETIETITEEVTEAIEEGTEIITEVDIEVTGIEGIIKLIKEVNMRGHVN